MLTCTHTHSFWHPRQQPNWYELRAENGSARVQASPLYKSGRAVSPGKLLRHVAMKASSLPTALTSGVSFLFCKGFRLISSSNLHVMRAFSVKKPMELVMYTGVAHDELRCYVQQANSAAD